MFMKILTFVFNYLLTRNQSPAESQGFFSNFNAKTFRKVIMMFAGMIGGVLLFLGGFFTVLMDMILASQAAQQLALSQASIVGFTLILLSAATFAVLFSRKAWDISAAQPSMSEPKVNPVHEAVAELIRDFTEERRIVRMAQMAEFEQAAAAAMQAAAQAQSHVAEADITTGPVPGPQTYPGTDRAAFN